MKNRRLALYPVILVAILSGCQAFHDYRPVAVMARDAETKQPIPGAEIRISYPLSRASNAPSNSLETTGVNGVAHLRAAPYGEIGVLVEVTATGYMAEDKTVAVAAVQAIESAHLFESVEKRPPSFVLDLYKEPRPSVELVVPVGFRGQIKADVQVKEDAPSPAGQRSFSYLVSPAGTVQVIGPHLLGLVLSTEFRASYADGTPIKPEPQGEEIGMWFLKYDGKIQYFLIGTRSEYDSLRPSSPTPDGGQKQSTGGKGSGGRKNRKGGNNQQPPPDPTP